MKVSYGGVTINVYGREGQDIWTLADEIEDRRLRRRIKCYCLFSTHLLYLLHEGQNGLARR